MEKAQKLLQKGKLKDTIGILDQVMEIDPADFRVLLKKGELEQRIGDAEAAKTSYTKVAEQYSSDGFYLKAVAIYKKILKLDGEEFHIYSKLAQLYRKLGLDSEAKKHLKVVAEYYKAKGLKTNYHEVAVQLSEMGESISDTQIEFVEKFAKDGDRDKAIEHFRAVSEKFLEGGNISQLDTIVKKMDELQMQDLEVYGIQAKAYLNAKEPKKALQVIQRAYAMQPKNTSTLELLARCFLELKQPQKTASVFSELLKIYDRNGDMRNLNRVRGDLQRLNDPNAVIESLSQEEKDEESYETVNREESEEFIIEEVQVYNPASKTDDPAPETQHRIEIKHAMPEVSFSELEEDLESNAEKILADESLVEENFEREVVPSVNSEDSFMNVFVDAFDSSEETVLSKPSAPASKTKSEDFKTVPIKVVSEEKEEVSFSMPFDEAEFEKTTLDENSISFQNMSSFDSVLRDVAEPTKIDIDESQFSSSEETIGSLPFNGNSIQEKTVLETPSNREQLVDFDQFYSDGNKEKSEISIQEEEFVSISQFEGKDSKPKVSVPPEKIEIHDHEIIKSKAASRATPAIKQAALESQTINADIEPSIDFSNLDLSEVSENLKMPSLDDSTPFMRDEPSIDSREVMQSLLVDPEPESDDGEALAKHIELDEKTMLDLKHEFNENSKVDRSLTATPDDSFFDLAGELKEEISEFERNFGKPDDAAEEEFLSPEEVILEFKKGIARTIDKNDYQTHYNLGVAYKEMGLLDEAISAFELSSTNAESRIDSISMIGMCLAEKNDYEAAVKLFLQTLPTMNYLDPKYLGIMYQLGEAYMELGRHVDAYKAFAKVKDLDANFRDAKGRVKELGFNLGIKDETPTHQSGRIIVDMKDRKKNKL
jgi:tetratricopeptide (TPR) repeat protein